VHILLHFFLTFPIKFQGSFVKRTLPVTKYFLQYKTKVLLSCHTEHSNCFTGILYSHFQFYLFLSSNCSNILALPTTTLLLCILENTNTYIHKVTKMKLIKSSNFCFSVRFSFRVLLTGANVMDTIYDVTQYRSTDCVLPYFFQLCVNTSYYMTATIFVCIRAHVYLHTRLCMHKTYRKTQ